VIRSLTILLVLGGIAAGQTTCETSGQTLSEATLRLRAYNVAGVSRKTLNRALEITGSIFARANVQACWEQGDTDAAEAHYMDMTGTAAGQRLQADDRNYLAVKIMRGAPANAFPGALGFALPFARRGPHAVVFYDRIEDVLPPDLISISRLLGHAIAHEAGHALLETTEHTQEGLMKSKWGKADFRRAGLDLLEFTPAETRILLEHARRREALLVANRELVANGQPSPPGDAEERLDEGNCFFRARPQGPDSRITSSNAS
jgi:hypothetical protein